MSAITGAKVTFRNDSEWEGVVLSDSYTPGTVRVAWTGPEPYIGVHRIADLIVIEP